MQVVRRTLFEGELLSVGHFLARPPSSGRAEVERQVQNVLVLPLAGVFARHDGPRRHVIVTPNHATLIPAGVPYRVSYPDGRGDQALTLRFKGDQESFALDALLEPQALLARSLLWRQLERGEWDALDVEEQATGLLACALRAARRNIRRASHAPRRSRQIERVKEAIALQPERKWTLGDLAGLACLSPCHLAHVFRAEVGAPVYQYVLRSRLARALEAVLESDAGLTAIALENGFTSHSHFTARFRALFGLTPAALRAGASRRKAAELRKIVTARAAAAA
jgi:AraC-like DNA-binding protein